MSNKFIKSRTKVIISIASMIFLFFSSCKKDIQIEPEISLWPIEKALDAFVTTLIDTPPTSNDISERIKIYLLSQPLTFFGSTVSLLDSLGKVSYSPYWYRINNLLAMKNLADTAYHINEQDWLRKPIDSGFAIWTEPYFDAGGGEIWMRTRSVPVYINGKIIAVATTDLEVKKP